MRERSREETKSRREIESRDVTIENLQRQADEDARARAEVLSSLETVKATTDTERTESARGD